MAAFGENLRREREMRGVGLEEISAATKISVRFLEAIENDEFESLPGGIFTRSFIRGYAHYLGLDEDRVLSEFELSAPPTDLDLHRLVASRPPVQRQVPKTSLGVLVVAAGMLLGGYALFRYSRRPPEAPAPPASSATPAATTSSSAPLQSTSGPAVPPPTQTASPTAAATPATSLPGAQSASTAALPSGSQAASSTTPASSTSVTPAPPGAPPVTAKNFVSDEGLVLQLAATERTWVAVDADGKTKLQRTLEPNEVETLKARESFDITTGNASGVVLTLNGETLKPLGRRGEVKSVHLSREDLKNSP